MSEILDGFKERLNSDDLGVRMKALSDSRSLGVSDRFVLAAIASGDRNARVRYDAVSQLSTIGNQDLEKSLAILSDRLLTDPENDVRAAAADSIGALKLTAAFDSLKHAYETTNDWMMQFSVVAALGELGDPKGLELLTTALHNPNDLVKIAAIGALGDLGDPAAIDLLLPFVENTDWQMRHRVAQSLGQLGGDRAKAALEKLAQDPAEQVADSAKLTLAAMQ
ncbi:HEAT repeat domain-containing protein [Tumidithrix elongata RA019]|uniref:HEAT repeat domain-containing protein n=1 Tax=Tumidithrix elongata BACA0141 TaxID=2716417 RepID=A0AAW9PYN4_9CYAN|nr:HEAT repeat domain-containing protein [Tumidithrix elongata RA019]